MCELSLASGVTEDWTNQEPPRHRERDNKCDIPNVAAALQFAEPTGVLLFQLLRMPAKLSRDMLFCFLFINICIYTVYDVEAACARHET